MDQHNPRHPYFPLVSPGEIDCAVADMTATIAADVPLERVAAKLAEFDQWLPMDGDPRLPIGQLVEQNSTGPLRLGFGAWRDLLLGVQFRNGKGELISAGGRVVKNVAGYDLTKFMVGQRGVFGTIVTLTTRTYHRPAGALVARFEPDGQLIEALLPTSLRPQWALLGPDEFTCGYLGDARTLDHYEARLPEPRRIGLMRRPLEEDMRERELRWGAVGPATIRAAVPPARILEFITRCEARQWVADPAFGAVLVHDGGDISVVAAAAREVGGSAWRAAGPPHALPMDPAQRSLLSRLKAAFDPDGTLTPLPQ